MILGILYNTFFIMSILFGFPIIAAVLLGSKKRRKNILHRLGMTSLKRENDPTSQTIWVHALSVGEVLSALPLIEALTRRFKDKTLVFSATTHTGIEIARKNLSSKIETIFYFPFDTLFSVRTRIRQIQPDLMIIVETDIWPNILIEMNRQRIPVLLVNARLSERSFRGYRFASFFISKLFGLFSSICVQTEADASRFLRLGVRVDSMVVCGNIKFDQPVSIPSGSEVEDMRRSLHISAGHPIFLAGSTHEGEEAIIGRAFLKIRQIHETVTLIIVPRDPRRAGEIASLYKSMGFSVALWSDRDRAIESSDVLIVDTIGILRYLYAVATVAFVGGSLLNFRGHNPIEPAALSKPILFGPYMSDFSQVSNLLLDSGGALLITDSESLYQTVRLLLDDLETAKKIGRHAFNVFMSNQGALEKTLDVIDNVISR